jgi:hypothetical protein
MLMPISRDIQMRKDDDCFPNIREIGCLKSNTLFPRISDQNGDAVMAKTAVWTVFEAGLFFVAFLSTNSATDPLRTAQTFLLDGLG